MHTLIRIILLCAICTVFANNIANAEPPNKIRIEITDRATFHVHPVMQPIKISLMAISDSRIQSLSYQWVNHMGQTVSEKTALSTGVKVTISSPPLPAGYYGLQISGDSTTMIEDRIPGEVMEFGFSVQSNAGHPPKRFGIPDQFGMIHVDLYDPYMPGWIKTMTWKTAEPGWWGTQMEKRRQLGLIELPIIVEDEWESDDKKPVPESQLNRLEEKVKRYFVADRETLYWELGIEENLTSNYGEPYYWRNLASKTKRIREVVDQVNPDIKLIYQVTEIGFEDNENFLKSEAAEYFDILSVHPYAWPDFPMPENWLAKGLEKIQAQMKLLNRELSIWFTEVGAPHHGNYPGGFFGYPEDRNKVDGLSRADSVSYLIQLHAIALSSGVEKLFWYNYHDRGEDREFAEDHFGMVDYRKFPKPVYTAYNIMYVMLKGKTAQPANRSSLPGFWIYSFADKLETVDVIWSKSGKQRELDVSGLENRPRHIISSVGAEVLPQEGKIIIANEPIFLRY